MFGDLVGLKLPDIRLTGEENPQKTSHRKFVLTGNRTRVLCVASDPDGTDIYPLWWISVKSGGSSQIHSPHLHIGAHGILSDILRSVQMLKRERERGGCRKQWEATATIQTLVKLQPWLVSLRWKIWLWQNCSLGSCHYSEGPALGQNTLMMMVWVKVCQISNEYIVQVRYRLECC